MMTMHETVEDSQAAATNPAPAPAPALGERLREPRLHERAAVVLASDVVSGRLATGDPFPSADEIVSRLEVSRTVAREALQTLSMLGLVRVQHGRRSEVLPTSDWNVLSPILQEALRREGRLVPVWRDLYEFRLLIEPRAAAWMAERGADEDFVGLMALIDEMQDLAEAGDVPRFMAADQAFHSLIASGANNQVLSAVSHSFWKAVASLWLDSNVLPEQLPIITQQHREVAEAIASRDAVGAAAAMSRHLEAASALDVASNPPPPSVTS